MSADRRSVYVGRSLRLLVGEQPLTTAVNTIADRYYEVLRLYAPTMPPEEVAAVVACLDEAEKAHGPARPGEEANRVRDAVELFGAPELVAQMTGATFCERLALADIHERGLRDTAAIRQFIAMRKKGLA